MLGVSGEKLEDLLGSIWVEDDDVCEGTTPV